MACWDMCLESKELITCVNCETGKRMGEERGESEETYDGSDEHREVLD